MPQPKSVVVMHMIKATIPILRLVLGENPIRSMIAKIMAQPMASPMLVARNRPRAKRKQRSAATAIVSQ